VGELPLSVQPKLLCTLETKEIVPLGSNIPVKLDVRVIAATHRDLRRMVQAGRFREDLLFRLNVVNIQTPPLRERPEDIPLLVDHFLGLHRRNLSKAVFGIGAEALRCLLSHPWKGNVRELSNVIERAMLLCEGNTIHVEDLPANIRAGRAELSHSLRDTVQRFVYRHIVSTLETAGGNRNLAAKMLGLSPATLYRYLERFDLIGYHAASGAVVRRLTAATCVAKY
jgi:two-component system response regulator HydG